MEKRLTKLRLFRSIAEYTYDWESWIRQDGALGWVNAAVERITGYSVDECVAMEDYPLPLVHPDDRSAMQRLLRLAAEGGQGNDVEFRVLRKDGAVRWGAVSFQPLLDDSLGSLGYRASVRDIHERKEMEAGLEALRVRAEAADRAKTELLARVSHELRTPIHCISGYAELLIKSDLDPERRRHAEIVHEQAKLLLRQVEDLLDMATLESGDVRIEHESFSLPALVDRVCEAKRPLLASKGLSLSVHRDASLHERFLGDEHRLAQVIRNIVENAIKYTDHGGIEIELHGRPGLAGVLQMEIVVRDTGVGIDEKHLPTVTQEFVRAVDDAHRERAGKGLGLAIADRLVRAMGGTISIASELGKGTRVTVEVPLEVDSAGGPAARRLERPPDADLATRLPLHILVVDDTAGARELLVAQLTRLGYQADAVGSGVEALRLVFRESYDLVLLDLWLPDIAGDEVAARVADAARRARLPRPRMVAVTASGVGRHGLGERAVVFDAVLPKPLSMRRLQEVIEDLAVAPGDDDDPLIDREVARDLRERVDPKGGDLLERYLGRVAAQLPSDLDEIRAALERSDREAAARKLHSLVGLLAVVGARAAATHGRAILERLRGDEPPSNLQEDVDALTDVFAESKRALERFRSD
jgi:PAS domain S-box-containing protein